MMDISVIQGDITRLLVDAVVNAANNNLRGGGGVDGAIHRAGGPAILEECIKIGGCATGEAVLTTGGNLPAQFVIHTVGPVWSGGKQGEAELLANAYKSSLILAEEKGITSVAFPNISTGIYGFPKREAASIAIDTVKHYESATIGKLIFVCFDDENYGIYTGLI